jgi:hypothetical protein
MIYTPACFEKVMLLVFYNATFISEALFLGIVAILPFVARNVGRMKTRNSW